MLVCLLCGEFVQWWASGRTTLSFINSPTTRVVVVVVIKSQMHYRVLGFWKLVVHPDSAEVARLRAANGKMDGEGVEPRGR